MWNTTRSSFKPQMFYCNHFSIAHIEQYQCPSLPPHALHPIDLQYNCIPGLYYNCYFPKISIPLNLDDFFLQ